MGIWLKINIGKANIEKESSKFLSDFVGAENLSNYKNVSCGNLFYYCDNPMEAKYLIKKYESVKKCKLNEIPNCFYCKKKMDNNNIFPSFENDFTEVGIRMDKDDNGYYGKFIHQKCLLLMKTHGYKENNKDKKIFCSYCNRLVNFEVDTYNYGNEPGSDDYDDDMAPCSAGIGCKFICKRCGETIN